MLTVHSKDQKCVQRPSCEDHSYAELSDVPTEPYKHDSDSQDDIITNGGKLIISSSDKVEISLEYQCGDSLPEATKEGIGTVAMSKPTGSVLYNSSTDISNDKRNIPDKTSGVINLTKELPDNTTPKDDVLPDEIMSKNNVLSDKTNSVNKIDGVLPDKTVYSNNALPEKTHKTDSVDTSELQLSKANTTSSDLYSDTTATTSALREATDTTNKDLSVKTPSSVDDGTNK